MQIRRSQVFLYPSQQTIHVLEAFFETWLACTRVPTLASILLTSCRESLARWRRIEWYELSQPPRFQRNCHCNCHSCCRHSAALPCWCRRSFKGWAPFVDGCQVELPTTLGRTYAGYCVLAILQQDWSICSCAVCPPKKNVEMCLGASIHFLLVAPCLRRV